MTTESEYGTMTGMVNHAPNPAVRRVQLGITLRLLREAADIRPRTVTETMVWHSGKVTRLEKGEVTISDSEVKRLADLYGVEDRAERTRLERLAEEARKRGRPPRVPDWGQTYVALETAASEIKATAGELFPGMLQTESYAKALLSQSALVPPSEVDDRAAERAQRGRILANDSAPDLWVVVSEAALHRTIGGPEVFVEQLRHVRALTELENVTFQVIPFSAGVYTGIDTVFTLIHLSDPVATYAYLEGLTDADYLDKPAHTVVYVKAFDKMRVRAASDRESAAMLVHRIGELE